MTIRHGASTRQATTSTCYEGGVDDAGQPADTRTPAQRTALIQLLQLLLKLAPQATILGHRDLSPDSNGDGRITPNEWIKQCPCFDALHEYQHLTPSTSSHATE